MKRGTFRKKSYEEILKMQISKKHPPQGSKLNAKGVKKPKNTLLHKTADIPKKRTKKSPLKKLKEKLWKLCREIQIAKYGRNCYTCGAKDLQGSNLHLGHFIPSSVCSTEMRYDLDNLRPCCYHCNINLSGNWIEYEKHLIRDGIDVQELKDRNEKTKGGMYREDWYENKIREYTIHISEENLK